MLRDEGDEGRHPGEELPTIVLVGALWPVVLNFWSGFVMQSVFVCCFIHLEEYLLIN